MKRMLKENADLNEPEGFLSCEIVWLPKAVGESPRAQLSLSEIKVARAAGSSLMR